MGRNGRGCEVEAQSQAAARDASIEALAVKVLIAIASVLAILALGELALALTVSDASPLQLVGAIESVAPETVRSLASTVSRAANQLLGMVLSVIALAVPLTANMYTPKLIEMFIRDRINLAALMFFAVLGSHSIFAQAIAVNGFSAATQYFAVTLSGLLGFVLLVPYFLYLLRFLNPATIIRLVRDATIVEIERASKLAAPGRADRERVHDRILQLGNVILRAVDRADRDVTLAAIAALEQVLHAYAVRKGRFVSSWFATERRLFLGRSHFAVSHIARTRTIVEHDALHQLRLVFNAALTKMPDAVSAISDVNRRTALDAIGRGDDDVLELSMQLFNTFIREAIKAKNFHAIHDTLYQYRLLAHALLEKSPARAVDVVRYFKYYGDFARAQGMSIAFELSASEVAQLVEWAYEQDSKVAGAILELALSYEVEAAWLRQAKGFASLWAFFRQRGLAAEAARVRRFLGAIPSARLRQVRRDLTSTEDPVFWEVTDRMQNFDYVEPERRTIVDELLSELIAELEGAQLALGGPRAPRAAERSTTPDSDGDFDDDGPNPQALALARDVASGRLVAASPRRSSPDAPPEADG